MKRRIKIGLVAIILILAVGGVMVYNMGRKVMIMEDEYLPRHELRKMASMQEQYRQTVTVGKRYCTSLEQLSDLKYIDCVLGTGRKGVYAYTLRTEAMSSDGYINRWNANANPVERTGRRYFFIDESGVLRFNTNVPATVTSEWVR